VSLVVRGPNKAESETWHCSSAGIEDLTLHFRLGFVLSD
jgi:hypothetical protein